MVADLRRFLEELRESEEILDIYKPVDIRHLAALVDKSPKALLFHNVIGYDLPVVSGLMNSRKRIGIAMGCDYSEAEARLSYALDHPIPPVAGQGGAEQEIFREGASVDLFELPVPVFSVFDGGPMITAGVTLARDPEYGLNAGTYRFQVKERNLTGIDIVTPNNLRRYAEKALDAKQPLPISINIGTHPIELMASLYKAPIGTDELGVAGGLWGKSVRLASCRTVDVPCIVDSEFVLEAEILPTGWTKPEGRFGEFTCLMGGLHWNPHVRVKAITRRKDAIYYALHMPWENIWMKEHGFQAMLRRVLKEAGVQVKAINVTPGACCHWHAIISIKRQPGDPMNAIMGSLSVGDLKHVVIVDDDINVFDAMEVEWAIASRVQADRDIVIISNARSKPLDPSLLPKPGGIPTTAKCGIDATIPDNVPRERYDRITYAYADRVRLEDYLDGEGLSVGARSQVSDSKIKGDVTVLAERIRGTLENKPVYFSDLAELFAPDGFQAVTRAMGELHRHGEIWQDSEGRHCLAGSRFAASPPTREKKEE
jgi:2,5-furandicarboxylate decarboxylase 1